MTLPTLTVISGPPGAGKTTLAHALAARIGGPAICRDEIKEGMVAAERSGMPAVPGTPGTPGTIDHDLLNRRALAAFFGVLEVLLRAGTSTVAEAAYQDRLWRPGLSPLLPLARILVIRCRVSGDVARARQEQRLATDPRRGAHGDREYLSKAESVFDWPRLEVPTLDVATDADPAGAVGVAEQFVLTSGVAR